MYASSVDSHPNRREIALADDFLFVWLKKQEVTPPSFSYALNLKRAVLAVC